MSKKSIFSFNDIESPFGDWMEEIEAQRILERQLSDEMSKVIRKSNLSTSSKSGNEAHSTSKEYDITINENGIIIGKNENIIRKSRLFINLESGRRQEIILNDPERDQSQLFGVEIGRKLVHFLDIENQHFLIKKGYRSKILRHFPLVSEINNFLIALSSSRGGYRDFGFTYLAPQLSIESISNSTYNSPSYDDSYSTWDEQGGFIFFIGTGKYKVYNIPDAGNFLWGMAMHASNGSFLLSIIGANLNEVFRGGDSSADQTAIAQGYQQWGRISNPVSDWIGYSSKPPSFWRTDEEIEKILKSHGYKGDRD